MRTQILELHTGGSESITDITGQCSDFVARSGGDGLLNVFVPHATAGVAIIELGAGSDDDLLASLDDLLPPTTVGATSTAPRDTGVHTSCRRTSLPRPRCPSFPADSNWERGSPSRSST